MQTFLPEYDYAACAAVLDDKRLNKQLLEVHQIFKANATNGHWARHPASKMWRWHPNSLLEYASAMRNECERRGIKWQKNWTQIVKYRNMINTDSGSPRWDMARIVNTHRASLFRKDAEHYSAYANTQWRDAICCERCQYYWPSHVD